MLHKDQWKKEAHYLAPALCSRILSELIEGSIKESESATFYRREIEKCQQYISLVQAEATRVWEPPAKPEQFENIEDVQFFHSQFCLKSKLLHLQQQHLQEKPKLSHPSPNNLIRGSMRHRASSMTLFAWSQHRYSTLKQQNQAKLKQRKGSRQLSLQKLVASKKEAITHSEKELREALLNPKKDSKDRKRPYRKMALRKKEQPIPEEDAGIPVLVQIAYNIGQQMNIRSLQKKQCLPKLQQRHKEVQKTQSTMSNNNGRRLVISQYQPNRGQIKVNSWRKFHQMIEAKPTDTPNHTDQFTNIHYFTETTAL